jgi:hypothetical protein
LNSPQAFEDYERMHYTLLNFNTFLLTDDRFPRFAHMSFEKRLVAVSHHSKGFSANPGNVSNNRKRGIALLVLKSF